MRYRKSVLLFQFFAGALWIGLLGGSWARAEVSENGRPRATSILETPSNAASNITAAPVGAPAGSSSKKATGDELLAQSVAAFETGHFGEALQQGRAAYSKYQRKKNREGMVRALLQNGSVYLFLGESQRAETSFEKAGNLAEELNDPVSIISARRAQGSAAVFARKRELAERLLAESLELAQEKNLPEQRASVYNDLGALHVQTEHYDEAAKEFDQALQLAQEHNLRPLMLRIRLNKAVLATSHQADFTAGAQEAQALDAELTPAADTYEKAFLLLGLGQVYQKLAEGSVEAGNSWHQEAYRVYTAGQVIGQSLDNPRILTYAEGYLGHLYEQEKRDAEALTLTRQAAFHAQGISLPDALYLWQWQEGRLFLQQGQIAESVTAYRNALNTLQLIRNDLMGYGNRCRCASFREEVGPLYYQMSDVLLRYADTLTDEEKIRTYLLEARGVIETFKSVELADYFQSDCMSFLRSKIKEVTEFTKNTSIVYIIPLKDRIEFLITLPSGLKRVKVELDQVTLYEQLRSFRKQLEDTSSNRYKKSAKTLYDELIRPIEALLEADKIDTLVFVPDGLLRTIPMAALHDGKQFLIEKYALAITPGMTLMEPKAIQRDSVHLLLNGLSEAVHGFAALPFVPQELDQLGRIFPSTRLMNETYTAANMEKEISATPYTIVHIASHGQFTSRAEDTFVLTMEGKLSLDGLEALIRPAKLRDNPIELLTLSACQTAAGDDRAAMGLAGIAIKAGARSAMGTLWFVSDQATATVLENFYTQLKDPPMSKAKALQQAQISLLKDERFRHPRYWSPYLLIGNWL